MNRPRDVQNQTQGARGEALLLGVPVPWGPSAEVRAAAIEFLCQRAQFVGQNVREMLVDQGFLEPKLNLKG